MYIQILKGYLTGYVRIVIEGYFIEKFMNLCIKKGILLWNTNRKKTTIMEANVSIKKFRKIIKIAKETKCKVKIKQKKGIPFIFHKYKKRKIFFVFLFVIFTTIFILSNFIWNIEIEGNINISKEELIQNLKENGISIGIPKYKVNIKEIINKIRLNRNDLAWIGIELKGTNAIVKVVEADEKPDIIAEDDYCNIIAKKVGVIVKVNAINGTPLVKEGDIVKEGEALIGGWLEGKYTGINYVHANGEVQAKVWYIQNEKVNLKQVVFEKTGRSESKYSVRINNFTINFYKTLSKFEKYDTIEETNKLKIFSQIYMPIEFIKKINNELQEKQIEYTIDDAKQEAVTKAKKILEEQIENKKNILNTYINYNQKQDYLEAQVIYEVLEEIGTKEKIIF